MPEGFLSRHLTEEVAPGTIVRLAPPRGEFVLPDPPPSQVLFLTAGSGITPIMAMLRTLSRRGTVTDVVVVHSAPRDGDVIFASELETLAERHPSLTVHVHLTGERGRLDPDGVARVCPDWRDRETWACGPEAMLDEAERMWGDAGRDERLHVERFSAALRGGEAEGGTVRVRKGSAAPGTESPEGADTAGTSRSTAPPPCSRPASPPVSSCPTAAGWASATRVWSACAPAPCATCATGPNVAPTPTTPPRRCRRASPRRRATAFSRSESPGGQRWPSPTCRSSPT